MIDLNKKAKEIYEQNKAAGWWDGEQCIYTKIQLISTEIAEATEGERKGLMDDHIPHRKMGEVELADALIRTLDLGGYLRLNYIRSEYMPDALYWKGNAAMLHLSINRLIVEFAESIADSFNPIDQEYTDLLDSILCSALDLNYDIISAMNEKLEYNKNRADHKRENRQKEGGKKF